MPVSSGKPRRRLGCLLYLYAVNAATPIPVNYSDMIESLTFTTVAPGGFADLTVLIKLAKARLPRAEFALFSAVALVDTDSNALFIGEVYETQLTLDMAGGSGEYVKISALGIGNCLRDDPATVGYTNRTAAAIIGDQLNGAITGATLARSTFYPRLSSDISALFAGASGSTYSPAYQNRTMEEVVADVVALESGSSGTLWDWFVWDHPTQQDTSGFPKGQVVVQKRDTTTTHYSASVLLGDIAGFQITQSGDRAENRIRVDMLDNASTGVFTLTATDTRLAASGAQGTAPFRLRTFRRSLVGLSNMTNGMAQNIANTYLAQMQSVTNKVSITLKRVRDANGNPMPLQEVRAGKNILVPELAPRGAQLPLAATAGVTQFYIMRTTYTWSSAGDQTLTLEGDNYADRAAMIEARLQNLADLQARIGQTTTGIVQALGAAEKGACGGSWQSGGAAQVNDFVINFRTTMAQAPTSITLANLSNTNVTSAVVLGSPTVYGFTLRLTATAAGFASWGGTYTTVGN